MRFYLIKILNGCCLGCAIFLSGCFPQSTSPGPAFRQVRQEVSERTGYCIDWACNDREVENWVNETLKQELTLDQTVKIALINNPRLKANYERLGIAQAELVQAGLLENPIFSFSLKKKNLIESSSIIDMGIIQNFLDILLKPLKKRLARSDLEVVKAEVASFVLETIAQVKIAYVALQSVELSHQLNNKVFEASEASFEFAERFREAGNITDFDLASRRLERDQARIDALESEIEVFDAKERLTILLGLCTPGCFLPAIDWDIPEEEFDLSSLEACALERSLELRVSREKIRATAAMAGIEITERVFPEFDLGIDSEREPDKIWFLGPHVSVAIPVFDWGQAKSASARAELRKLWNEHAALGIEIRSAARSAVFRLKKSRDKSLQSRNALMPSAKQATRETLLQLNAMQLGIFTLLEAKRHEIEMEFIAVQAWKEYQEANTELETLLSGIRMGHVR